MVVFGSHQNMPILLRDTLVSDPFFTKLNRYFKPPCLCPWWLHALATFIFCLPLMLLWFLVAMTEAVYNWRNRD